MSYIRGEVYIYASQDRPGRDVVYLCSADHLVSIRTEVLFPFAYEVDDRGLMFARPGHDTFRTGDISEMLAHVQQHIRQYDDLVRRLRIAETRLAKEAEKRIAATTSSAGQQTAGGDVGP